MVKYGNARLCWEPNATGFINAIDQGIIAIDFDAHTQATGRGLRDHGTKFRIKPDGLERLYSRSGENRIAKHALKLFIVTQFRTENRFPLFLELL
ncbi:MAG: MvaI/BcnI family restriction endonuclease [Hyphomicrobiales bacterium]